jgi:hypothetical protein
VTEDIDSSSKYPYPPIGVAVAFKNKSAYRVALINEPFARLHCRNLEERDVGSDFEHFNVLHFEVLRTREKCHPAQFSIVVVAVTGSIKIGITAAICVAVVGNGKVIEVWTTFGITHDGVVLLFGFQSKFPRRDLVWILQRENETFQTRIHLPAVVFTPRFSVPISRFPFHRSETAENVPFRVQNHRQSVRVTVTAAVKIARTKTVAAAALKK